MKFKNAKYLLIAICLTSSLMLLKKVVLNDHQTTLRNLFLDNIENYVCRQAGSRLTQKYTKGFVEKLYIKSDLNKAQQSLVDFAKDRSYSNIKPYIKRLGIFITFIVLDIILIFLWISYCGCCCCSCCLFGRKHPSKLLYFISFIVSASCNLLVIIFSIVILSSINPLFERINGFGCSTIRLVNHVIDGLSPSYPYHADEWTGIDGIIQKLNDSEIEKNDMYEEKENITPGVSDKCSKEIGADKDEKNINDLFDSSFNDIDFDNSISDLQDIKKDLKEADDDIRDNVYDTIHIYVNKYGKRAMSAFFSLPLVFGVLGLATLCIYFFFRFGFLRIIYIVIWNISLLLMILIILFSAIFGIVSYLLTDGITVTQYTLSPKNLYNEDPLAFDPGKDTVKDIIDICANGNGSFVHVIKENDLLSENIKNFNTNISYYKEQISRLDKIGDDTCNGKEKDNLRYYYQNLTNLANRAINISNNLTDVNCRFIRSDKNIIFNEVKYAGSKTLVICSSGFLVGIFLGLSVLAGIAFFYRYNLNDARPESPYENNINDSNANIEDNNNSSVNVNNDA